MTDNLFTLAYLLSMFGVWELASKKLTFDIHFSWCVRSEERAMNVKEKMYFEKLLNDSELRSAEWVRVIGATVILFVCVVAGLILILMESTTFSPQQVTGGLFVIGSFVLDWKLSRDFSLVTKARQIHAEKKQKPKVSGDEIKNILLSMPNVGRDEDFDRNKKYKA